MDEELKLLRSKAALLESQLDMMLAEREHLNRLLLKCGFMEGIPTLMRTVEEVLDSGEIETYDDGSSIASSDG